MLGSKDYSLPGPRSDTNAPLDSRLEFIRYSVALHLSGRFRIANDVLARLYVGDSLSRSIRQKNFRVLIEALSAAAGSRDDQGVRLYPWNEGVRPIPDSVMPGRVRLGRDMAGFVPYPLLPRSLDLRL